MKDTVKISKETYEKLMSFQEDRQWYASYQEKYYSESAENKKLQRENGYLGALFDKEADTEVIKYNGNLYRIISTTHSKDADGSDFLDISAGLVRGDSQ